MYSEAQSASAVVARQLTENEALTEEIGNLLRERQPQVIVTCARGSSDNAATYGKYLIETFTVVRGYDPDSPPHLRKVTETM